MHISLFPGISHIYVHLVIVIFFWFNVCIYICVYKTNIFTLYHSVKGIIPNVIYNNRILYHDAKRNSDTELTFT